jgi:hypothetical protein
MMSKRAMKYHVFIGLTTVLLTCIVGMVLVDLHGLPSSQALTATAATIAGAVATLAADLAGGKKPDS